MNYGATTRRATSTCTRQNIRRCRLVGVPAALKCLLTRAQHCACHGGVKAVWPVDAEPVLIHFDEVSKSVVGEARGGGEGSRGSASGGRCLGAWAWADSSWRARQCSASKCIGSKSSRLVGLGRARATALGIRRRARSWTNGAAARSGPTASILLFNASSSLSKCGPGGPARSASRARTTESSSAPGLGGGWGSGAGVRVRGSRSCWVVGAG